MPSYADSYHTRSEPARHLWFSVETPSVFKEIKLPACNADWTKSQWTQFNKLEALAEAHGTHIQRSTYRRG